MIKKSTVLFIGIVLFPIMHLLNINVDNNMGTLCSYYDEIIGCLCVVYITALTISNKLFSADRTIYSILIALTGIGIVSNCLSGIEQKTFAILVDIVSLWKPLSCYLAFKHLVIDCFDDVIKKLASIAKLTILFVTIVAVIGQFVNIGVTQEVSEFGVKTFVFFWDNTLHTGWLLYGCVLVLAASRISNKAFFLYLLLVMIPLFLTSAFTVFCWMILEALLLLFLKKNRILKKYQVVLLSIPVVTTSMADISKYILNDSAPRAKLIRGGIEIARKYFPFGSGFATFGSEMASRYYSPIYRQFGWTRSWGLGIKDNQYLNDNFFASIVGQFGWIGFFLYLIGIFKIFQDVNSHLLCKRERATALAIVLTLAASMLISATGKSALGAFAFSLLGMTASHVESKKL
ncbi:MAG: hypothetical protein U0L84_06195 [Acutalibacteraceae bacterium]|nr:hypothetical protein [Acutalibacteraceae bacterium]